jgi:hypothetical protein
MLRMTHLLRQMVILLYMLLILRLLDEVRGALAKCWIRLFTRFVFTSQSEVGIHSEKESV